MKITRINTTQTAFLQDYLRGTGKTLTEFEAREFFDIGNLRARMSDLRANGLKVATVNTERGTAYKVSARDVTGSRAHLDLA
jgi:hypothetical protein